MENSLRSDASIRFRHHDLSRMLKPRSVAIVGASDNNTRSRGILEFMNDPMPVDLFLVNPTHATAHGLPCHRSLDEIGRPVDLVLSLVNAERSVGLVEDAVRLGAGGCVIIAGGFREAGEQGRALEERLIAAAGQMPLLGPNCNGFTDFHRRLKMSGHPPLPARPGGIGLVTHSGGMIGAVAFSAHDRAIGMSSAFSVGNEVVVDMVDCLDFLIEDESTRAICLIIESIRRPDAFLAAVERAHRNGKPIVALKLARTERSRLIAKTHTGAIAGDARIYDMAFRQHGIIGARTLSELVDKVACFDQLPASKWTPVRGLAVLTTSGGWSGLAEDVFAENGTPLPELESVKPQLRELLPEAEVANPLDMTGFAVGDRALAEKILQLYAESDEADTLFLQWFVDETALHMGGQLLRTFVDLAQGNRKTFIVGSVDDARLGPWAAGLPEKKVGILRGLETSVRALQGMGEFVRYRERSAVEHAPEKVTPIPRPPADQFVASEAGDMLTFGAAMDLLQHAGIRTAPYCILRENASASEIPSSLLPPYVVKLADIPHRTDVGAVRLGVSRDSLAQAVEQMRALAKTLEAPRTVVVQSQLPVDGEAFIGVQGHTPLGPAVMCGVGGIFVELFKRITGALVPFSRQHASAALDELADAKVFEGLRGGPAWDRERLIDVMMAAGNLARAARGWIDTIDINPLAFSGGGFVALDCLCIARPSRDHSSSR